MSFLTKIITLGSINLPYYYIVIALILLLCLFLLWYQGVRDGFDKEKLFDIFFLTFMAWGATSYLINYLYPYDPFIQSNKFALEKIIYFAISLGFIRYFTFRWRWSFYRILDIFSLVYFVLTISLFSYQILSNKNYILLIPIFVFILAYIAVFTMRNRFFSGLAFSLYLLLTAIFGQFFFKTKVHLIFYFALITISMVNLFIRNKKAMFSRNLDTNLIRKFKELLGRKKKRLEVEQKKLIEQDPYLQEGRDTGNSEEMDEAILEDQAKTESDIKKGNLEDMEKQVDKALNKMEEGEYGICEICGEAIDKARLEVYPEATTCMSCADKDSDQS